MWGSGFSGVDRVSPLSHFPRRTRHCPNERTTPDQTDELSGANKPTKASGMSFC